MEAILQSTPRLVRALLLLGSLTAAIYLIITGIFKSINSVSDISISTNDKGGFIINVSSQASNHAEERYAQFLLPSNSCWYNTGLDIGEDEECEIRITGRVHLAFNKLYNDVENDSIPNIKWTGPDGSEWEKIGDDSACEDAKTKLLIMPGKKRIGNVVGYLHTQSLEDKYFIEYFLNNRRKVTEEIRVINHGATIPNDKQNKATLYLAVNDILLDLTDSGQERLSRAAFEGRKNIKRKWERLKSEKEYYRLWFDDNVGGFLVNVTIRRKK